jgi:transcriptional regulator with XRE-family HTH domain
MPAKELGTLIASALIRAGCTKRDGTLSTYRAKQRTGVSDRYIMRIVRGEVSPSIDTLERLFDAIGWEVVVSFFPRGESRGKPAKRRRKADT